MYHDPPCQRGVLESFQASELSDKEPSRGLIQQDNTVHKVLDDGFSVRSAFIVRYYLGFKVGLHMAEEDVNYPFRLSPRNRFLDFVFTSRWDFWEENCAMRASRKGIKSDKRESKMSLKYMTLLEEGPLLTQ